jgi:predicted nucleotidyltransferase component of viral defense system
VKDRLEKSRAWFGQARDLDWLRRQLIIALAADDQLFELLVFKGGNALAIAHGVGMRTSLDLDYSLAHETSSDAALGERLQGALSAHLSKHELTVFDWRFGPRPKEPKDERAFTWGGYEGEFKVIETTRWESLSGNLELARKQAWGITASGGASRKFIIELSKSEYCDGADEVDVGGFMVRVYTPSMIVAEKLRSLCQQMSEYEHSTKRKPRARDFYDIHAAVTEAGVNVASSAGHDLIRSVFAAKDVPLRLLANLERDVEFHEAEWDDVRNSIPADRPAEFSYYSVFVLRIVRQLEPLWNVDLP